MVSEAAEREWLAVSSPDTVCVQVKASWHGRVCLPCPNGDFVAWAKFAKMTCVDYWYLVDELTINVELGGGRDMTSYMDMYELRRQFIRRFLREWNLGVPLEFDQETGWMTRECFEVVGSMPGSLLMELAAQYESDIFPDIKEQQDIDKQCALLFSDKSLGVSEPCETVALYCVSSNFWDKFGLNRNDLRSMPYREFLRLRLMVHRENLAHAARRREDKNKPKAKTNLR
jgi:hypothetical protein